MMNLLGIIANIRDYSHYSSKCLITGRTMAASTTQSSSVRATGSRQIIESGPNSQINHKLWLNGRQGSNFALFSPFVLSLATGELHCSDFATFISRDNMGFLKAMSIMSQKAADKAEDDETRQVFSQLSRDLTETWTINESFLKEMIHDSSRVEAAISVGAVKMPETLPCIMVKNLPLIVLASTAATLRMYTFLAQKVKNVLDPKGGNSYPYKGWIEYYAAGSSIKKLCEKIENLLDLMHVSSSSNGIKKLESLYHLMIMRGVYFIGRQLGVRSTSVVPLVKYPSSEYRIIFFSNFDMSCTSVDSSHELAKYAIGGNSATPNKQFKVKSEGGMVEVSAGEMWTRWKKMKDEYRVDYQKHVRSILESEKVKKFNYRHVVDCIKPLSDFQKKASLHKLAIKSGLLLGLKFQEIRHVGRALALNPGCLDLFRSLLAEQRVEVQVNVLSCCWCSDVITSSIPEVSGKMGIHANQVSYDYQSHPNPDGSVVGMANSKQVESSHDKLRLFESILHKTPTTKKKNRTVYVGHGMGDLLCLLKADIGIVYNDCSTTLKMVAQKLKITLVPLFPGLVEKQKEHRSRLAGSGDHLSNSERGILYTAESWSEITALFFSCEFWFTKVPNS
ncbi:hypothetical protein SAY86_030238 [Trapa natans]|uniref:Uncharacterized protein n=1 Tax=Trapa natans TaxID=22666 RepID=A0AAN7RCM8_TRANT|nr:hypothetical protein SAY86_030238 [Trapa natans]